jgi:type 1 glutamine amidotransferase
VDFPLMRLAACVLAMATVCCRQPATPTPATPPGGPAKRLVVVTHTTGFRHDSIATAEAVITRLATESALFAPVFCRTAADVARLLTPSGLAETDGVFFVNTTGNLGIADLPAFLAWIGQGRAFLGAHSASDTYHDAPEYLAMLGAEFDTHGDQTTVDIRVEDTAHPAGAPLPSPWRIFDEIYEFRANPRARVNVLLSLDRHPNDGHAAAGQPGDFPLAWYRTHGNGRVFYTALGHRDEVWNDTRFQQHLLGALRWALGAP